MSLSDQPTNALAKGRVTHLVIESDLASGELIVRLTFSGDHAQGQERIEVTCRGARQVKLLGEHTLLPKPALLMATDIGSRGWDNIRYRVIDYEEELISLFCREVSVTTARE